VSEIHPKNVFLKESLYKYFATIFCHEDENSHRMWRC